MSDPITMLVSGGIGTGKSALRWLAPNYLRDALGDTAAIDIDEVYMQFDPDWSQQERDLRPIAIICELKPIKLWSSGVGVRDVRVEIHRYYSMTLTTTAQ